jgi:hypothetical protein
MRQGFQPLADSRTNKRPPEQIIALRHKPKKPGFSQFLGGVSIFSKKTRFLVTPKISETGFLPKSPTVTKDSRKNPVSRHPAHPSEKNLASPAPNIGLCSRGFNRRVIGNRPVQKPIPIQESLIFGGGEQPDF